MANIKISDLTAASVAADANEFEINESGTSKKVTGSQIKAYVNSGDGALAVKDTVATADIDNLAVTNAKLGNDSVNGSKIADNSIDSEHYVDGSIDAEHIANSTITGAKIATDTITATNIAANAVGASELNVTGNGTSGQFLASDGDGTMTWTDAGGGGAWNFISSTTFSNTTSYILNFSTLDSYDMYMMVLENVTPSSDNVELSLWFGDNGASFDTVRIASNNSTASASYGTINADPDPYISGSINVGSAAGERGVAGIMYLQNFNDSGIDGRVWGHVMSRASNTYTTQTIFGFETETTAEDSIQIKYTSGNLESGKAVLYGLNYS